MHLLSYEQIPRTYKDFKGKIIAFFGAVMLAVCVPKSVVGMSLFSLPEMEEVGRKEQSGKTEELFDKFFNHFLLEYDRTIQNANMVAWRRGEQPPSPQELFAQAVPNSIHSFIRKNSQETTAEIIRRVCGVDGGINNTWRIVFVTRLFWNLMGGDFTHNSFSALCNRMLASSFADVASTTSQRVSGHLGITKPEIVKQFDSGRGNWGRLRLLMQISSGQIITSSVLGSLALQALWNFISNRLA